MEIYQRDFTGAKKRWTSDRNLNKLDSFDTCGSKLGYAVYLINAHHLCRRENSTRNSLELKSVVAVKNCGWLENKTCHSFPCSRKISVPMKARSFFFFPLFNLF